MLVVYRRMKGRTFGCFMVQVSGPILLAMGCPAEEVEVEGERGSAAAVPENAEQWQAMRARWIKSLVQDCLPGGDQPAAPQAKEIFNVEKNEIALRAFDFAGFGGKLRLYVSNAPGLKNPDLVVLNILDDDGWTDFLATMRPGFEKQLKGIELPEPDPRSFRQHQGMFKSFNWVMAYVAVTGVGQTRMEPALEVIRDGQMLNQGQTIDNTRVQDARMAVRTLRDAGGLGETPLWIQATGRMAGVALYASLFEPGVVRLDLHDLPRTHAEGPFFFRVRRYLDVPQAVAMALQQSKVVIYQNGEDGWEYPKEVARKLEWTTKLQIRSPAP